MPTYIISFTIDDVPQRTTVRDCNTPEEALAVYRRAHPDHVVTGVELLRITERKTPEFPKTRVVHSDFEV